jgi:hypothetical protein
MKAVYYDKFSEVIEETWQEQGFYLPPMIRQYVAAMLADHVERTDFFSQPFAIRYMEINTVHSAKDLGDNCLVMAGFFPEYRSMGEAYYISVGRSAYSTAASATQNVVFGTLADNFDTVSQGLAHLRAPTFL